MLCALSILALALGLVNAQPSGASWPMLGGGAGGASFSLSAGRRVAPSALWAFGANKTAYPCTWCPPAVGAGGIIYALGVCNGAASLYSQMVALGPAGDLLWAAQQASYPLMHHHRPGVPTTAPMEMNLEQIQRFFQFKQQAENHQVLEMCKN